MIILDHLKFDIDKFIKQIEPRTFDFEFLNLPRIYAFP